MLNEIETMEINFNGLHFQVEITPERFTISKIRITNQETLADFIERDLEFDEQMVRLIHNKQEREERKCLRNKEEKY